MDAPTHNGKGWVGRSNRLHQESLSVNLISYTTLETHLKHFRIQTAFSMVMALVAQTAIAGSVNVTVLDSEGNPAANVVVMVKSTQATPSKSSTSSALIEQRDLKFVPFLSVVPVGSTVRFTNRDSYDHHVRSMPSGPLGGTAPAQEFELRLDGVEGATLNDDYSRPAPKRKPGGSNNGEIKVAQTGAITLGCHLHSSMRGHLYVVDTPWFAKTDAAGKAVIDNVPDATADISLWHPDQLQTQPGLKLQVAAGANNSEAKLNFVPRKRRGT
jgi:plastocyanin